MRGVRAVLVCRSPVRRTAAADSEGVEMKRLGSRAGLILVVVAASLVVLAATAAARTTAAKPIVIGWAFDSKGAMAPFDNPALAAAQLRVKQVNARGGVGGRPLQIQTCDTQGNKPAIAKACALKLLGAGADVIFTTCDVDYAAPVVHEAISRLNAKKADVVVTSTAGAFGALSTLISGLRSLGNDTPILNSWAGDGTYWLPKSPKVTNYYFVTYASIFGDDPNPAINKLAKQVKAGTGGFIAGSAAIDGLAVAINRSDGSTTGATLAATMQKFKKVPTLSGLVSFSPKFHTVFGRQYRVIKIQDNKAHLVGTVVAKVVPKI